MSFLDDIVSKKWTHIKDTFNACRRAHELKKSSGAGACEEPRWKWWPSMKFMLEEFKLCTSESNVDFSSPAPSVADQPDLSSDSRPETPASTQSYSDPQTTPGEIGIHTTIHKI